MIRIETPFLRHTARRYAALPVSRISFSNVCSHGVQVSSHNDFLAAAPIVAVPNPSRENLLVDLRSHGVGGLRPVHVDKWVRHHRPTGGLSCSFGNLPLDPIPECHDNGHSACHPGCVGHMLTLHRSVVDRRRLMAVGNLHMTITKSGSMLI